MRLRLSSSFNFVSRSYATRRPIKPPPKIVDPVASSSNAEVAHLPDGLTFTHRPPPTAPSPFSTTILPASPLLRPSTPAGVSSSSMEQTTVSVPPRARNSRHFPDNRVLTEADFEKMRELRASNPGLYTRLRLAKEFNCPPFLVAQQAPLEKQTKNAAIEKVESEHEEIRSRWGERKSMVAAIRKKRREFW